jgi:acyl-CoA dehydrogenase
MGSNSALKREAVAALEAGGLLAFGVSEKGHGSDLLGNEFTVSSGGGDLAADGGGFVANGTKYYIGNANCASMIAILARKGSPRGDGHSRRAPFVLFALRPSESAGFQGARKIRTLGVRAAFVGEFEVKNHEFSQRDVAAEGRQAWDAVFGTVALGKFFLGFGSIGICEHALEEAAEHLGGRWLYGKPAIQMPHIRSTMAQAYARLTAMKLYAYRALDYVHAARSTDRRYLLFAAVQKAKVSTEGVRVMALLCECMGAKAFEADTYFEMALRDAQLIPGLEGSAHINLGLATQFIPRYFGRPGSSLTEANSLIAEDGPSEENAFLPEARTGAIHTIAFPGFLDAYRPLMSVANVRPFARAAKALQLFVRRRGAERTPRADTPATLALGQCFSTIAYAQLIAENAVLLGVPTPMVAAIFHGLLSDLSAAALNLASCLEPGTIRPALLRRLVCVPTTADSAWDFVSDRMAAARPDDCDGRPE